MLRVTHTLGRLERYFVDMRKRAAGRGRRRALETSAKLAVIHQHGGRQVVTRRVQLALISKVGRGARIPRVGSALVHPERPVRASARMARQVALDDARHIVKGTALRTEPIMREDVERQFSQGFEPPSRDWGNFTARRPTLGGPGGRVAQGWRQARYAVSR